ncbi:MAG: hypothetical protein MI867_15355, partial [Pseudomonadales bacterium]|nr:hypothetical protein [Pseudomonadales bacterium]
MGTKISELLTGEEANLEEMKGKTFTVDAYNILYQFLSNIRQRDGSYLTDSQGNVTSHLVGLFSRLSRLMMNQMNFIFCFDGEVPELKYGELEKRKEAKEKATTKYQEAIAKGNEEEMRKY